MSLQVSVVVPTYKRAQLLHRCLNALVSQAMDSAAYEIVVVDDARSDETEGFVRAFARASDRTVRYVRPGDGHRGPAAARNAGWKAAAAPVIAFTDDDTIPCRDWLKEGLKAMAPGIGAAWGHVEVPLPENPTDAERNTAGLHGAEFITANCLVLKEALARFGGFDERFKLAWREDSDLYFTLLENGWKVVAAPDAIVIHPARAMPRGTCLRQHRNLFFDALLYKKHPALYRQKISAGPPLRYYFTVLALALALGAVLAGAWPVAGAAAAAWLAFTLALIGRRLKGISKAWEERLEIILTSLVIPVLAVYWRLAGALHFRVVFA